jgi:hypothetical protein
MTPPISPSDPTPLHPATLIAIVLTLTLSISPTRADDWKPPPDGKFTEDQLKKFLAADKDWNDQTAHMLQDIARAKTDAARMAAVQDMNKKYQACLASNNISKAEFDWMSRRAMEAWSAVTYDDEALNKTQSELDQQSKDNDARLADAQDRLAKYQDAQKRGIRAMTAEDRAAAMKSAKFDQQSALDEARQCGDNAAADEAEAKGHDADARADDAQANNPPTDLAGNDRQSFIDGKKKDAQSARDAARDARNREDDAKKAQADAQARADAAGQKAAHPEIPITDDDKASVASDNQAGINSAQSDITDAQQQKQILAATQQQIKTTADQLTRNIPPENMDLMRKYSDQYKVLFTQSATGPAATQPAK